MDIFLDSQQEKKLFCARLWLAIHFLIVLFIILLVRLFDLQIIDYKKFSTLSNDNRIVVQPIPPVRGLIYDTEGELIADNIPSFTLSITPDRITSIKKTLAQLQQMITIPQENIHDFLKLLKQRKPFEAIPVKYQLSETERARIAVDLYRLPGVNIEAQLIRHYPYDNLFSSVTGYVGRISDQNEKNLDQDRYRGIRIVGKSGLERYYENILLGTLGYKEVEVDVVGHIKRVIKTQPSQPGQNLYLYINRTIQQAALDAMQDIKGAVVALDPKTGGVLAMVSTPTYNPNLFVTGISYQDYKNLSDNPNHPLYNRSVLGLYPPASTIKPILALAGLAQHLITPEETINDPGFFQLPGFQHKYRNWKQSGQGIVNLHRAIMQSNDTYFYHLAVKLDIENIHKYTSMMGYGKKPNIDFPVAAAGVMPSKEWKKKVFNQPWYPGETVISGIGQGYMQVTPLQLAIATAIIANRGAMVTPRLSKPGNNIPPTPIPHIIDHTQKDWQIIIQAMQDVITPQGTGWRMGKLPFTVAGKTGTAQVIDIAQDEKYEASKLKKTSRDHGLFIAFAPVQNPKIALAVVTENQHTKAVIVAKKILMAYLDKKKENEQNQTSG